MYTTIILGLAIMTSWLFLEMFIQRMIFKLEYNGFETFWWISAIVLWISFYYLTH